MPPSPSPSPGGVAAAARELRDALPVNPYDAHDVADTLERAIAMAAAEQRPRMRAVIGHHNAYRWAAGMLKDARQQRLEDARAAWREPAVSAS